MWCRSWFHSRQITQTTPAMLESLRICLARVTERGIPLHIRMLGETSQRVAG